MCVCVCVYIYMYIDVCILYVYGGELHARGGELHASSEGSVPPLQFSVDPQNDESSASSADVPVIASQPRVTQQLLSHWQHFRDLKHMFAVSR
jgi:hypothetical protein